MPGLARAFVGPTCERGSSNHQSVDLVRDDDLTREPAVRLDVDRALDHVALVARCRLDARGHFALHIAMAGAAGAGTTAIDQQAWHLGTLAQIWIGADSCSRQGVTCGPRPKLGARSA